MPMMNPYFVVEVLVVDYVAQLVVLLVVLLDVAVEIHCAELLSIHSCCCCILEMPIPDLVDAHSDVAPPELKESMPMVQKIFLDPEGAAPERLLMELMLKLVLGLLADCGRCSRSCHQSGCCNPSSMLVNQVGFLLLSRCPG